MEKSKAKPYIIGIAGSSGSGKTEFLKSFSKTFNQNEIAVISQDDYYFRVPNLTKEENKLHNFDLPAAIDREAFYADILNLIAGKSIVQEEYTFNNPARVAPLRTIKPAPILVIEGLFIYYYQEINELLDYRIFIHADDDIALKRRIKRDALERGYNQQDVIYKWEHHVRPAYKKYLHPYKHTCNQSLENNGQNLSDIEQTARDISAYLRQYFF